MAKMRGRVWKAAIGLMVISRAVRTSIGHLACPLPPPGKGITIIPFSPLNTLSCSWLDNFTVTGPYNSNVWSHTVVVIVPKVALKVTNISMAYLTGNCNHDPKPPKPDDEELVRLRCSHASALRINTCLLCLADSRVHSSCRDSSASFICRLNSR